MKRTLNINIGNSLIHIEEDAYELLTGYLNEIKAHFAKSADDFEIVTDIENRIAEMFREILTDQQKAAINTSDVQTIIAQMGTVRDFQSSEEEEEKAFVPPYSAGIKRLYRDTEQGMVAGVCAGLGHYLNIEDRWIRLFALLSVLVGGAGILAYFVMWIIVPRAQTRSEKMYMKGEAINLQGFIRNFQDEMENNQLIKRSGTFITEFIDVLGKFISGTGKTIFKFVAGTIILMSGIMLLGLIVVLAIFLGVWDAGANEIFPLSMVDQAYQSTLLFAAFIFFAVPLLALLLFSARVAFSSRPVNKAVSFSLLIVWLLGTATGIFYIAKVTADFKEEAEFTQTSPLKPYATYTLALDKSRFFSKEDSVRYQINSDSYRGRIIVDHNDGPFQRPVDVRIRIERSMDGKFAVVQNFSAHGRSFDIALKNAQSIHYDFLQQDSVLNFSPKLYLTKNNYWRNQEVNITVKVPVGTKLILNKDLDRYLEDYRSWNCDQEGEDNRDFAEWVMTEDGLKCQNEINGEHH
ncbi:PspC domain-containing protein [Pedobacter nutrimenti]|uniref:PspC domain-containing protein n=1 Tax=Pedobacter nutrimenti TaxID=1241337 RepID=UPI00292F75AF|nr:PspC domain-containing protein [Pedobacter nutrimenti]